MAINYTQTDSATGTCGTDSSRKIATDGGTAGSVEGTTAAVAASSTLQMLLVTCTIADGTLWNSGTVTTRLDVTTSDMDLTITQIDVLRRTSACASAETLGSATSLSISLGSTGVKSQDVTIAAASSPANGDKLLIVWRVTNANSMFSRTFGWTPDQNIDSPFTTASAALTGTITPTVTEADIVTGGNTLIITLTGDTWIAAGVGSFDLQRDEIIAGCTSAQSELLGWNNVVKVLQSVGGVARTSDTICTITWDAFGTYDITATETITVTVPGTAVVLGNAIVATPTFTVTATSVAGGWGPFEAGKRNHMVIA